METTVATFFFITLTITLLSPYQLATGHGTSMQPQLTGTQILTLKKARINDGDIVAYESLTEGRILHRVNAHVDLKEKGFWYWICGDNPDHRLCEWVEQNQIHGKLDSYMTIPTRVTP